MISSNIIELSVFGQTLVLASQKALYWKEQEMLIISDVHLGKAGHFRKHGIAVPVSANNENITRLQTLVSQFNPTSILFLGDLFHSDQNLEWDIFKSWSLKHQHLKKYLIVGNHDFYEPSEYEQLGLIVTDSLQAGPFLFVHNEEEWEHSEDIIMVSGHIHPSIRLKGKARQSLRLPCFQLSKNRIRMPAFGTLTGTFTINPTKKDRIFAILDHQLLEIS